ncbi:hypothetical protein F5148DRAFT_1149282 [Russula earlei]|uniref:Uncharacterized protein n=1 Tax=Russula earlei TaxID=71964 RepID=A0ACC0U8V7_9AGAM|nr:hypothetical protein F5148DRAFT_1149282 [Russula earlei]
MAFTFRCCSERTLGRLLGMMGPPLIDALDGTSHRAKSIALLADWPVCYPTWQRNLNALHRRENAPRGMCPRGVSDVVGIALLGRYRMMRPRRHQYRKRRAGVIEGVELSTGKSTTNEPHYGDLIFMKPRRESASTSVEIRQQRWARGGRQGAKGYSRVKFADKRYDPTSTAVDARGGPSRQNRGRTSQTKKKKGRFGNCCVKHASALAVRLERRDWQQALTAAKKSHMHPVACGRKTQLSSQGPRKGRNEAGAAFVPPRKRGGGGGKRRRRCVRKDSPMHFTLETPAEQMVRASSQIVAVRYPASVLLINACARVRPRPFDTLTVGRV